MLKLRTTFHVYNNEINDQLKKSIKTKFIKQITQSVLTGIAEDSRQADFVGIDRRRSS